MIIFSQIAHEYISVKEFWKLVSILTKLWNLVAYIFGSPGNFFTANGEEFTVQNIMHSDVGVG